ncbi:hypothetical protein AAF712_006460 [Marasmius tenuissimus]|uniref:gamma-glutamylcyclotransferase n=1 Tax=Marasmius tenuissimus TaxID=585030 RepID=A0ABR2ZYI3_9AGAR
MSAKLTLYFAYGSNIWMDQMKRRCPESRFIGVAKLERWRWIISTRGYANVVPSQDDYVYGFIYELNAADESTLDRYEGVPASYTKHSIPAKLTKGVDGHEKYAYTKDGKTYIDTMVYINTTDIQNGKIKKEYIFRMNQAMQDGLREGIPKDYFDEYLVPFISAENAQP